MKSACLAMALLLGTTAAHAQDNTTGLREALSLLPEFILTNPSPDQAYFLNVEALRQLADGPLTPLTMQRIDLASGLRPVEALRLNDAAGWLEKSGIDIENVDYFAGFGTPPQTLSIWGLDSPEAAEGLLQTLKNRGFQPNDGSGLTEGLANGVPMNVNIATRDPANPWIGEVGQTSVVGARGKVILQSAAPEPVALIQHGERNMIALDNIVVATALGGIEQAAGDMWLVQAMLVSPALGLAAIDPADALLADPGNLDEIIANTKARITAGQEGIPPFLGGFIADMQFDAKPAAVISLTYPDCATAALAGPMIEARWTAWPQSAKVPAQTMSITSEGENGACAAVVTIVSDTEATAENPISRLLFTAFIQRQLSLLQIGLQQ